jgi:hypothetical protein
MGKEALSSDALEQMIAQLEKRVARLESLPVAYAVSGTKELTTSIVCHTVEVPLDYQPTDDLATVFADMLVINIDRGFNVRNYGNTNVTCVKLVFQFTDCLSYASRLGAWYQDQLQDLLLECPNAKRIIIEGVADPSRLIAIFAICANRQFIHQYNRELFESQIRRTESPWRVLPDNHRDIVQDTWVTATRALRNVIV